MLRDKVDQQNRLWNRMQEIQRVAEDEKRDWTAEERTNWDAANVEITTVSADIERLERMANLGSVDYGQVRQGAGADTPDETDTAEARAAEYEAAFAHFTRSGLDRLSAEHRQLMLANAVDERAVGTGQVVATPTLGGYLVPPGYRAVMTEALKAYGGMLNLANVITTSTGNPLQWPTNDDTSNVGAILEEANVVPQQNVTFGTKTLGAYMYTSKLVLVSYQLLQDSAFDLDNWLPGKLGERIGRALAAHLISGTGVAQPEGIITAAVTGVTAAATAITYDNIIDLEHSVDPAYRGGGNCRFVFNDSTLAYLRKLKDSQQRPLWLPVPVPGMPATINGVNYSIDQAMPSIATGLKSVLFGDFKAGFLVRQVLDVQMARLAERYADFLQVGFFAFARYDSEPDAPGAVRVLIHA
jgi:HK97 family phage major capsid protein